MNCIGPVGAIKLGENIGKCKNLKELTVNIGQNGILTEGAHGLS